MNWLFHAPKPESKSRWLGELAIAFVQQLGAAAVVNQILDGVASRMGWLRTIAAVHHQMNLAVATPLTLHIECKNVVACDSGEINLLPVLGVRGTPNLDAIPDWLSRYIYHAPA
jgi:hypothetical protein